MTHAPRLRTGVILAALVAGPLFLLTTILSSPAREGVRAAEILSVTLLSVPAGAIVGILPILSGGAAMRWLASHNEGMRLPVMWALIGGFAAAGWFVGSDSADDATIIAFAVTGAACALICRAFTRWS